MVAKLDSLFEIVGGHSELFDFLVVVAVVESVEGGFLTGEVYGLHFDSRWGWAAASCDLNVSRLIQDARPLFNYLLRLSPACQTDRSVRWPRVDHARSALVSFIYIHSFIFLFF